MLRIITISGSSQPRYLLIRQYLSSFVAVLRLEKAVKTMNILITVCARGGSKGIPGKNIKPVGGKPLIAYTIEAALQFAKTINAEVELSTDSSQIKAVAAEYGLPTEYVRPDFLANDVCGKPEAIRDVMLYAEKLHGKTYDYVLDLDVTSPIRTQQDIQRCLAMILEKPEAKTIFSVSPCARNPYFNQVEEDGSGYCHVVIDGKFTARQSAPKVYDINGSIYVYRRDALDCENPRAVTDRSLVYVMDHLCFDLDEPQDYDYLAYLLDTGRLSI